MTPEEIEIPEWWCVGEATEQDVFNEWLKRGMDDVIPFYDYLSARKDVLTIIE